MNLYALSVKKNFTFVISTFVSSVRVLSVGLTKIIGGKPQLKYIWAHIMILKIINFPNGAFPKLLTRINLMEGFLFCSTAPKCVHISKTPPPMGTITTQILSVTEYHFDFRNSRDRSQSPGTQYLIP